MALRPKNIFNWTHKNKLQWNFNRNSNISFQENAFESVVYEMAVFLPLPWCVKMPDTVLKQNATYTILK